MRQRAVEGLFHLKRNRRAGIVWQSMVLSRPKREFRLQKEILTSDFSCGYLAANRPSHSRFIVMTPLVGRIDAAKTLLDREPDEALRLLLLPRRAVDQSRHDDAVNDKIR